MSKKRPSASGVGASLGEQKRLQMEQMALKQRLEAEDIFDDDTVLGRLFIRYKLPDIDMSWSRSQVTEETLERTFNDLALETATFKLGDERGWKTVLKRGYGLVTVVVGTMLVLYMIIITPLNASEPFATDRQSTVFWVGLSMRITCLFALGGYLCVLRYNSERNVILAATVGTVWVASFCSTLAVGQDGQLDNLRLDDNGTLPVNGTVTATHEAEVPGLPMLVIMAVYVAGVPGLPVHVAMLCGWGQLPLSLIFHVSNGWQALPWGVPLARELLFNALGTFVAYKNIKQMKRNHLHRSLLEEAAELEKGAARRMEGLTHNTVPKAVAERMIGVNDYSFAESYEDCTVLQSDIVGYTALMSHESAIWVLNFVSEIFEEFDTLCDEFGVDKIKTIGDAYVVCAGALTLDDPQRPHPHGTPPQRVVRMALRMQEVVLRKSTEAKKEVGVRIGVHTGWTAGGNIGKVRPHFDIWGPGVTSTVKMEEMGRTGLVHVSDATHAHLGGLFECAPRNLGGDLSSEDYEQAMATLTELGIKETYFAIQYLNSKLAGGASNLAKKRPSLFSGPSKLTGSKVRGLADGMGTLDEGDGDDGTPAPAALMPPVGSEVDAPADLASSVASDETRRQLLGNKGKRNSIRESIKVVKEIVAPRGRVGVEEELEDGDDPSQQRKWVNLSKEEKLRSLTLAHQLMGRMLRSVAIVVALVFPAFTLYDIVLWGASMYLIVSRAIFSLILLMIALLLTTKLNDLSGVSRPSRNSKRAGSVSGKSSEKKEISQATLRLANLALVLTSAFGAFFCILFAPDSSTQYMFALSLFQIWIGYITLNLPTKEIAAWQVLISVTLATADNINTSFTSLNAIVRPAWEPTEESTSGIMSNAVVYIYLMVAHVLGIWYNRVTRHRVNRHAKQQIAGNRSLEDSQRSLAECQKLLESVFPKSVFQRLQEESSQGESLTACETFDGCTFLFAKIVGLNKLTSQESGVEPAKVVEILQLIFDRFDQLADLFLVQKVRKTVYESYMLAAGLPDRGMLEGQAPRAHAVVSLAGVMVAVMEIINRQLPKYGIPDHIQLSLQIGIHSGSAIAGIMGHKRFQYDLCGDDVNVAARMMGGSSPRCINISDTTYELVRDDFEVIDRGERFVKGKGMMRQYFITGGVSLKAAMAIEAPPTALAAAAVMLEKQRSAKRQSLAVLQEARESASSRISTVQEAAEEADAPEAEAPEAEAPEAEAPEAAEDSAATRPAVHASM